MIYGIGTDIVAVKRIRETYDRLGVRFLERILADAEISEFHAITSVEIASRFLAKRFAAKEAFAKALGSGIGAVCGWRDVYVTHAPNGRPVLAFSAALQQQMQARNIAYSHISIADETDTAIAYVVLETAHE